MIEPAVNTAEPVVKPLPPDRAGVAVEILCEAFHDYSVMRYVLGEGREDYDRSLATLIGFSVSARVWRGEPMLAVHEGARIVAAAILTPPCQREAPPGFFEQREATWAELGDVARERYEGLGVMWKDVGIAEPNLHLNMIGVRDGLAGRGYGRLLLDHIHAMSAADPESTGVTLTTEVPENVDLYRHFGYEIVGRREVPGVLETWGFFRPDGVGS